MILTVTLNAAVDRAYRIDGFQIDRVHRPAEAKVGAGGKGINVARVYTTLGGVAVATGFLGGYNGRYIERTVADEGIKAKFVQVAGESRECIAAIDPLAGTQTEINERGPQISPGEMEQLKQLVRDLINSERFDFVLLCGSIPPGAPPEIYADLSDACRNAGVRCILDGSGEPLRLGAASRPWVLKPNGFEMEALAGHNGAGIAERASALRTGGTEVVCITRGPASAVCAAPDGVWEARPPDVEVVSAVGSGDAFAAAFAWAYDACGTEQALRLAVAAGAANALHYGSGYCTAGEIYAMAQQTRVARLEG